jgi:hypothetical protein
MSVRSILLFFKSIKASYRLKVNFIKNSFLMLQAGQLNRTDTFLFLLKKMVSLFIFF